MRVVGRAPNGKERNMTMDAMMYKAIKNCHMLIVDVWELYIHLYFELDSGRKSCVVSCANFKAPSVHCGLANKKKMG